MPGDWSLWLAVVFDGAVIGSQEVSGRDFAIRREVSTGPWLGRDFHGNDFGTEMRAAVLDLAFAGLGARYAVSGAYSDNEASLAVSRKLGYRDDGIEHHAVRGKNATLQRLRLIRRWPTKLGRGSKFGGGSVTAARDWLKFLHMEGATARAVPLTFTAGQTMLDLVRVGIGSGNYGDFDFYNDSTGNVDLVADMLGHLA